MTQTITPFIPIEQPVSNYPPGLILCTAYMHIGQYELALKDSEKCVVLAPADFVKAHFRLGKALLGLEQYEEAVLALTTALKLKKNNKEIREALQHALIKYSLTHICTS